MKFGRFSAKVFSLAFRCRTDKKTAAAGDGTLSAAVDDQPLFSLYAVIAFSMADSIFERFFSMIDAKSFLPEKMRV